MRKSLKDLKSIFIRVPFYFLVMLISTQIIKFDFIDGEFSEDGYVESFQLVYLGLTIIILFLQAKKYKKFRVYSLLLGLFFITHIIRENDAVFDFYMFEHAWKIFAYLAVAIAIYILIKSWNSFLNQVYLVKDQLNFGVLICGLSILHLFSRLYGKKDNWINLFEKIDAPSEQYRSIKNASEESLELLAYSIILISVIELYVFVKNNSKSNSNA
ncbi:MAG: hypothetical protein LAT51_13430 [Flavobacteriaceae bacterium]|nr:hypothetical protein [Flavobacteriaceae bacterium]